jgi:hypothetical protein
VRAYTEPAADCERNRSAFVNKPNRHKSRISGQCNTDFGSDGRERLRCGKAPGRCGRFYDFLILVFARMPSM